ncbi:uncharacterized protein BT62DRAFT_1001968 [Guyanagaster necrorhizus]|uniref:RRM domain-containing protein n=1 Tax=Guyanagaster necrorhizus TaxID=856835 RepID=A0A9P7VZY6_9AGAR|nr:uncharacterized protein BT62DRAFT_1001968 [Guyanagaster necrorhizus MCA 3950]KAG7449678.1 hypothetical protein BT62DRAFT_1001968 [Guyanagaster necrorhizus MCA 3950]
MGRSEIRRGNSASSACYLPTHHPLRSHISPFPRLISVAVAANELKHPLLIVDIVPNTIGDILLYFFPSSLALILPCTRRAFRTPRPSFIPSPPTIFISVLRHPISSFIFPPSLPIFVTSHYLPILASSTPLLPISSHQVDEDFINKSLLDSLDAQADAEPLASSDSDHAAGHSYGSASNSSSEGSSSVPYHMQPIISCSDSPPDNGAHPMLHHIQSQETLYNLHPSQNGMYTTTGHSGHIHSNSDYPVDVDPQKQQLASKINDAPPFRSPFSSFTSAARSRHHNTPSMLTSPTSYRESSTFYPSAAEMYPQQITSPTQVHMQAFELRANLDFSGGQTVNSVPKAFSVVDHQFTNGHSSLLTPHKSQPQSQQSQLNGYGSQYMNGIHLSSQTPYGPHIPSGPATSLVNGNVVGSAAGSAVLSGPGGMLINSSGAPSGPVQQQEDISTIFVVGFPDDMQEREFQNMFTFSPGFEAATLKIPNKEYTSYGGINGVGTAGLRTTAGSNYAQAFNGSNDPYNLVTVNQGGVVVDGGRDGMSSWPAPSVDDSGSGQFMASAGLSMPPRKQIIGFAKFRTREEALSARDLLQGRRVDIEKGAVLKAEMAKKNLHTKRGVGPIPSGLGGANASANALGQGMVGGASGMNGLQPSLINGGGSGLLGGVSNDMYGIGAEALNLREREYSAGPLRPQWRDHVADMNGVFRDGRDEEERKREREVAALNAMGLGATHRSVSERDDEVREWKRREKELRLRTGNVNAYDAFHSVPPGISRQSSTNTGLLSAVELPSGATGGPSPVIGGNGYQMTSLAGLQSYQQQPDDISIGPWDNVRRTGSSAIPIRPPSSSQRSSSPTDPSSISGSSVPFSEGPRPYSPSREAFVASSLHDPTESRSQTDSRSSSANGGSQSGRSSGNAITDEDMSRAVGSLDVGTRQGNTSPQLPSPASGASSGGSTRNGVDQNPPINTLYVGNLPISPPPLGYPPDALEESLRELFSSQPGYRRLSFKQKNTGPMCFVEFEDVNHAAKALNELYGHPLGGLVKGGGIRLSYSKNPLGVRTPTSATGSGSMLQQQQSQTYSAGTYNCGDERPSFSKRDAVLSPPPHHSHGYLASPPPRFFSSSPSSMAFGGSVSSATNFSRTGSYGYALTSSATSGSSAFSPFGVTPSMHNIPDHNLPDQQQDHHSHHFIPRALSPSVHNIEPARAV